jgi:glucan phosphorylase
MNEGHAAFLQLERIRELVQNDQLPFEAALWCARSNALFTTHTPVPAGNDAFGFELMDRFFSDYWHQLGLDRESFLSLGQYDYSWGPQFSMTCLPFAPGWQMASDCAVRCRAYVAVARPGCGRRPIISKQWRHTDT